MLGDNREIHKLIAVAVVDQAVAVSHRAIVALTRLQILGFAVIKAFGVAADYVDNLAVAFVAVIAYGGRRLKGTEHNFILSVKYRTQLVNANASLELGKYGKLDFVKINKHISSP